MDDALNHMDQCNAFSAMFDRLNASFLDGALALATKKRFAKLTSEAREMALRRVRRPGYRAWLGRVQQVQPAQANQAEDAAVPPPAGPNAWKHPLPFTKNELRACYQNAQKAWLPAMQKRRIDT